MARPKDNTQKYNITTVEKDTVIAIEGAIQINILECPDEVMWLQYNETFELLLAAVSDGTIRCIKGTAVTNTLTDPDSPSGSYCSCIRHRPVSKLYPITNSIICSYSSGAVKSWNYNFAQCIFTLTEKRNVACVAYHPKQSKFVTCGDDKKLNLYDEESRRQERIFSCSETKADKSGVKDGHVDKVTCAVFHPKTPQELVSGSLDSTIQFWDTRQPNAIRNIQDSTMTGVGIDFSSSGKEFVACCRQKDKACVIYEYATGNTIKDLQAEKLKNTPLTCGQFLNKEHVVVGGESLMRVINISTDKTVAQISKLSKPVLSITVGPELTAGGIPTFSFCSGKRIYQVLNITA